MQSVTDSMEIGVVQISGTNRTMTPKMMVFNTKPHSVRQPPLLHIRGRHRVAKIPSITANIGGENRAITISASITDLYQ
jgi:hypothetical protein